MFLLICNGNRTELSGKTSQLHLDIDEVSEHKLI